MAENSKELFNRDLSWLRFNHRVLQEAADRGNPLYERIKFLAIFSSNLDEFFKVRVSSIRQSKGIEKPLRKKLVTKPNKLLKIIKKEVDAQQEEFGDVFRNQIIPELNYNGIYLIDHHQFNQDHKVFSKTFFESHFHDERIRLELSMPHPENEVLYLVALNDNDELVWLQFSECDRFVTLPSSKEGFNICFIEDIIKDNLNTKFKTELFAVKLSRDAELYIGNEFSGNLLKKIENALPNRQTGQVTRMLIDRHAPKELLNRLYKDLDVNDTDTVQGGVYHNFKDFFDFPNPSQRDFSFPYYPPKTHPVLGNTSSIFKEVDQKDQLINLPYQSFEPVINWVEEAAKDETVRSIKITLYRVSKDSKIAKALLKALENGKQVFAFIETKARFDEDNNIKWGKKLEVAGATVKYSYPDIKVHSKILYFERVVENELRSYAYIGTGNFNEKTARIYTDFALLSADARLTSDLAQVFELLAGNSLSPKPKHLMVSPFNTRSRFKDCINREIEHANNGIPAAITLKMNSLQDKKMIKLLYKASNAGVQVRLLVRGICCLVPGIEGQSENITVTSIVDRFLEHGRLFWFANAGQEELYLGSADWMTRNLDHRIEVITPVFDQDIKQQLKTLLDLQLNDSVKARVIDEGQSNSYWKRDRDGLSSQSQTYFWYPETSNVL